MTNLNETLKKLEAIFKEEKCRVFEINENFKDDEVVIEFSTERNQKAIVPFFRKSFSAENFEQEFLKFCKRA